MLRSVLLTPSFRAVGLWIVFVIIKTEGQVTFFISPERSLGSKGADGCGWEILLSSGCLSRVVGVSPIFLPSPSPSEWEKEKRPPIPVRGSFIKPLRFLLPDVTHTKESLFWLSDWRKKSRISREVRLFAWDSHTDQEKPQLLLP